MEPLKGSTYQPVNFSLPELVPPAIVQQYGHMAWWFLDSRILWTADALHEYFACDVFCNRGGLTGRGLRLPGSDMAHGIYMSCHEQGKALDLDIGTMKAEDVREVILKHPDEPAFQYITRMETGVNWLHIDCLNCEVGSGRFFLFGAK